MQHRRHRQFTLPLVGRVGPEARGGVYCKGVFFVRKCPSRLLSSHPPNKGEGKEHPCRTTH